MSKTILVVDDEMLIALDIQSQLQDLGHEALVAGTLHEAIALVKRTKIDVAVVDWHLRDEIGEPLAKLLKQQHIPFLLCSGSSLEELAGLFPAAPVLTKPFASDALLEALDRLLPGVVH